MKENQKGFSEVLVILIVVVLVGVVGLFVYQNNQLKQENVSHVITQEQPTNSQPTASSSNPDPTDTWTSYKINDFGLTFKLPEELSTSGKLNRKQYPGETGMQICWNFPTNTSFIVKPVFAGGGACTGNKFFLGTVSVDYEAGRMSGFADTNGYVKEGDTYFYKTVLGKKRELPSRLVEEITNKHGVTILKIKGEDGEDTVDAGNTFPTPGTPGEGAIGALINLQENKYTGIAIQIELTNDLTEDLFDQILSTFEFTK